MPPPVVDDIKGGMIYVRRKRGIKPVAKKHGLGAQSLAGTTSIGHKEIVAGNDRFAKRR